MTPTPDHPALALWADMMAASRENYSETPKLRAETRVRLFAHALEATGFALVPVGDPDALASRIVTECGTDADGHDVIDWHDARAMIDALIAVAAAPAERV